jgi:hypothetical protein
LNLGYIWDIILYDVHEWRIGMGAKERIERFSRALTWRELLQRLFDVRCNSWAAAAGAFSWSIGAILFPSFSDGVSSGLNCT